MRNNSQRLGKKNKYPASKKKFVQEPIFKRFPVSAKYYDPARVLDGLLDIIDKSIEKNGGK
jgi:hypothetical protein